MVSYYRTAQRPIPRAIWLACLGWGGGAPSRWRAAACVASNACGAGGVERQKR